MRLRRVKTLDDIPKCKNVYDKNIFGRIVKKKYGLNL